ncbi:CrcB family protein [Actinobacillus indolicus]|uniref:Fluoride-specific ion channel FluC n=1 Tax=Actinobacillus indolicus TaxID=51049 RepID=A0A4P7CJU0_9PAST|nr:CrcB family protein [Actinobacillus indolicus]QBQ63491.1 CrcB family protein [Actinobacillus indolicus]
MTQILLISFGAVLGALSRWQLGVWLNPLISQFAFGTLLANVIGCFLIGIALGLNLQESSKLLFITGFLGSFTTFSAFSAEIGEKLLQEKWLNAVGIFLLHNIVGIMATVIGVILIKSITSGRI